MAALRAKAETLRASWSQALEAEVVQSIGFLATMALLESNLARKTYCYPFIHQQLLLESGAVVAVMQLDFRAHRLEVARSLGLLLGAVIKCPFSPEDRRGFKPNVFRMLNTVTDPTVRYWYVVSLCRLVQENNVTPAEMEIHKIYEAMLLCLERPDLTKELRYVLRIIAGFGHRLGAEAVARFYEKGLLGRVLGFLAQAPRVVFGFLQKLHGDDLGLAFPDALTEHFLGLAVEADPAAQPELLKVALKVGRLRLRWLCAQSEATARQPDLVAPLEEGLVEKLCYVVRVCGDLKLRLHAYSCARELLSLTRRHLPELHPAVAARMLGEGLAEQAREDTKLGPLRSAAEHLQRSLGLGLDSGDDDFDFGVL